MTNPHNTLPQDAQLGNEYKPFSSGHNAEINFFPPLHTVYHDADSVLRLVTTQLCANMMPIHTRLENAQQSRVTGYTDHSTIAPVPDNIAVMVNLDAVSTPMEKIVSILLGHSVNTPYPQEEESVRSILYECLNNYLAFTLPNVPQPQNISFEYYMEERFKCLMPFITDTRIHMFINAQWAIAVSELGAQLMPGIRDLIDHGQEIDSVATFDGTRRNQSLYVLTGVPYEELDGGVLDEGL